MSIINPVPGATYGTATLDFGALPGTNEASVVVTGQARIASTAKCVAFIAGTDTSTNHTASDHRYFGLFCTLTCGNVVPGVGFTIYGTSMHDMTGAWTVRYFWIN